MDMQRAKWYNAIKSALKEVEIMIADSVCNAANCFGCHPLFRDAFDFISKCIEGDYAPGSYPLQDDRLFANVVEFEPGSSTEAKFEAHRNYIDIQVMMRGTEEQGYAPIEALEACTEYSAEKDIRMFSFNPELSRIILHEGMFAIYFPEDGHIPRLSCLTDKPCKRIVVKVRV